MAKTKNRTSGRVSNRFWKLLGASTDRDQAQSMSLVGKSAEFDEKAAELDDEQLSKNEVPVYAAVYYDDMYVDFDLSMERASNIKGIKTFITNVMSHEAIRSRTEDVFKNIWALRDDTLD